MCLSFRFKNLILFCLSLIINISFSQEPQKIKVKKESDLVKVVFDNTEMRLMVIDRFGNRRENKILSYILTVKGKKETKNFRGFNNSLSAEMQNYLTHLSSSAKLFFTEIIVEDSQLHLQSLPDVIETWFPQCNNCETGKRKK